MIFRNIPYFIGPRGLYLDKWTPDFDPEVDIPTIVPFWVKIPHLPLHCCGDDGLRSIGNSLGKYIDKAEPKPPMFAYVRICVEVDLEKGLLEAIKLTLDGWSHIQKVDYEKLPFKCKAYHESQGIHLVDQYLIMFIHKVGFQIVKNKVNIL